MRYITAALTALFAALVPATGVLASAATSAGCFHGFLSGTIDCGGLVYRSGPSKAPVPTGSSGGEVSYGVVEPLTPAEAAYYAGCLRSVPAADSRPCGSLAAKPLPSVAPTIAAPANRPAPPPNPASLAVRFWQSIPLPVPRPAIPPGYAVTGKPAYLVTHGTTAPPAYVENTPLGTLSIRATGVYYVSWGDRGGWDGPYRGEGRPYPHGNIVHTYDYAGTVTVTVSEAWSATWTLAGATGTLTGLHTTATMRDFQVEQLQAVITN